MTPSVFTATTLVVVVASASCWVLIDARKRLHRGRPVVAVLLGYTIDQPATWAVLCLFLSVLFVPMYVLARSSSD